MTRNVGFWDYQGFCKIYVTKLIFLCNVNGLHALTTSCFCECQASFSVVRVKNAWPLPLFFCLLMCFSFLKGCFVIGSRLWSAYFSHHQKFFFYIRPTIDFLTSRGIRVRVKNRLLAVIISPGSPPPVRSCPCHNELHCLIVIPLNFLVRNFAVALGGDYPVVS